MGVRDLAHCGDPRIRDSARHDGVEFRQGVIAIEREPMHRDSSLHSYSDRRDLFFRPCAIHPDAAATVDAIAGDIEMLEDLDQPALEVSDVGNHIHRFGKAKDRIAHQLPGSVPGQFAATIDVDNRGGAYGSFTSCGASTGGEDGLVFEKDEGVAPCPRDDVGMNVALQCPPVLKRHKMRRKAGGENVEHRRPLSIVRRSPTIEYAGSDLYADRMTSGRPRATTRETIAEAACELFLEQGYEATAVADIARRAGVSRSSYFNYFDSKADVFWSSLDERISLFETDLAARPKDAGFESLHAAVVAIATDFAPDSLALGIVNAAPMRIEAELERDKALRQSRIGGLIADAVRAQGVRSVDASIIGAAYAAAVLAAIEAWAYEGAGRTSLTALVEDALVVVAPLTAGIATR